MKSYQLIEGTDFKDARGKLRFFNNFQMLGIKRFYEISPLSTQIIRAWQGHEVEQKWFYCSSGSFIINLVKVDNFKNPSTEIQALRIELTSNQASVLAVPGGYATGIKAGCTNSRLMVFSDVTLEESSKDDYRYRADFWKAIW